MKWLSDAILSHLCRVVEGPDLNGTRYELVEKIGQGGMGIVYLARDRELDRPVALKILNAAPDHAESRLRRVREARITARLEHPSIVPVHDAGELPDVRFFYAMKWVRGQRLEAQLATSTALTERLHLFQKICDAVAFAHAHGVLHRDLKPQNIMLGPFGEVLVLDWGIAKEMDKPQVANVGNGDNRDPITLTKTGDGVILGTPGYMAPEQAAGHSGQIDQRADVYALGAILFFLLTGKDPVAQATLTAPCRLVRSIPRPVEAVCLKALAVERSARYASVEELATDVADFLAGRRVRAYPEQLLEAGWRLAVKYRTVLSLLAAYLIMRILLLIFMRS